MESMSREWKAGVSSSIVQVLIILWLMKFYIFNVFGILHSYCTICVEKRNVMKNDIANIWKSFCGNYISWLAQGNELKLKKSLHSVVFSRSIDMPN